MGLLGPRTLGKLLERHLELPEPNVSGESIVSRNRTNTAVCLHIVEALIRTVPMPS